jgi:hypothetical protein
MPCSVHLGIRFSFFFAKYTVGCAYCTGNQERVDQNSYHHMSSMSACAALTLRILLPSLTSSHLYCSYWISVNSIAIILHYYPLFKHVFDISWIKLFNVIILITVFKHHTTSYKADCYLAFCSSQELGFPFSSSYVPRFCSWCGKVPPVNQVSAQKSSSQKGHLRPPTKVTPCSLSHHLLLFFKNLTLYNLLICLSPCLLPITSIWIKVHYRKNVILVTIASQWVSRTCLPYRRCFCSCKYFSKCFNVLHSFILGFQAELLGVERLNGC